METTRRRSPWWVRELSTRSLHGMGGKLSQLYRTDGLSDRQLATLGACESELAYRNRRLVVADRCTCQLCCEPFPD